MVLSASGAIFTALIGIGYFAGDPEIKLGKGESEEVFLVMSRIFFHPFVAGLVLAAVLAAIMSTMSSQMIVCASALVEDLYSLMGRKVSARNLLILSRLSVLGVAIVAALMALDRNSAILQLVEFAWAGFGAAFGPIVILCLYWRKLTPTGALAGLVTGAVTVFVWANVDFLKAKMYEIVPGFLLNLLVAVIVSNLTYTEDPEVDAEFSRMEAAVKEA